MKKIIKYLVLALVAIGLFWVFFPTNIPAFAIRNDHSASGDYQAFKRAVIAYVNDHPSHRLKVVGDGDNNWPLLFYCDSTDVAIVSDDTSIGSGIYIGLMPAALDRIPDSHRFLSLVADFTGQDINSIVKGIEALPPSTTMNTFFLKYRDGIDLASDCTKKRSD